MKDKLIKIIGGMVIIFAIPILLDHLIFANNILTNIDNSAWAGFFGSYIGGIATLIAVFITINDNNKKIEQQKKQMKKAEIEQRKYSIKPYLDIKALWHRLGRFYYGKVVEMTI